MSSTKYTVGSQFYYVIDNNIVLHTITSIVVPEIKGRPIPREIKIVHPGIAESYYITLDEQDHYHIYNTASLEQYLQIEKYFTKDYDTALTMVKK